MALNGTSGNGRQTGAKLHLAVFGLPLPIDATAAATEAAFARVATSIRLPVPQEAVRAVSYSPHACGGRGCARLSLPALAARAVLDAAPRLPAYGLSSISVTLWQGPAERQFLAQQRAVPRSPDRTTGRADAAATWRRPHPRADVSAPVMRSAAPTFCPRAAPRATVAAAPCHDVACMHPVPAAPAPVAPAPAALQPAPAHDVSPDHSYSLAPASGRVPVPSPAPPAPLASPDPANAGLTGKYQVEAFVARRRVGSYTEYLVKWLGFELVGEEAAYTWQRAAQLQEDLDRRSYRALLLQLRQAAGQLTQQHPAQQQQPAQQQRPAQQQQPAQQQPAQQQPTQQQTASTQHTRQSQRARRPHTAR